jgi:membrane protease YdiL (CAAX protease family)
MSNTSSKAGPEIKSDVMTDKSLTDGSSHKGSWGPVAGIVWALLIYLVPQVVGSFMISIYPLLHHWDTARTNDWLQNAISAQFAFTLIAESLAITTVGIVITHYKSPWRSIGLVWPKARDITYALSGFALYFVGYAVLISVVMHVFPKFNATQQQNVGFQDATSAAELMLAFISLVVLPPLAEEIVFRGFLFKGLRRKWSFWTATIITSLLFAAPHLIEGVGGLLWVGGVDTFILSIVLCLLREKTGRLTAGMGVHALKNGLAFASLFIFHAH